MEAAKVRKDLLEWYWANRRDLPWRRTKDPYAILVSEVMCQQTRVDVVIPYYETWMARWPTLEQLARADPEEVLAKWSGLGYYRRATNLQRAAQFVVENGWPENLQELPGIGPYIAGALASIAFDKPLPAIDGNVQRVLARLGDVPADVTKADGKSRIQALATALLGDDHAGDWTQAPMELGARLCTPTLPKCSDCPIESHCQATDKEARPVKPRKSRPRDEAQHFALVQQGTRILMVQRPNAGLLAGTWGLPGGATTQTLPQLVEEQAGVQIKVGARLGTARHAFSHRRWTMAVQAAKPLKILPHSSAKWVAPHEFESLGISTAMRKCLELASLAAPKAH